MAKHEVIIFKEDKIEIEVNFDKNNDTVWLT